MTAATDSEIRFRVSPAYAMSEIAAQFAFLAAAQQDHVEKPVIGIRIGSQVEIGTGIANIQCLDEHIIVRKIFVI